MQTSYLGYFGHAWLHTPKTSMFICMPTVHFIIHFFLKILNFKEPCNLIGLQHFSPQLKNQNFARYGIGVEILTTILVFILDYFQKKTNVNILPKAKKTYLGSILGPFQPNLCKNEFFWKKGLCQFLNNPTTYHHAKSQKKNELLLRKMLHEQTNCHAQTDRETTVILEDSPKDRVQQGTL